MAELQKAFRYFKAKDALCTLQSMKLKLSKPSELNDPFEFSFRFQEQDRAGYVEHQKYLKAWDNVAGLACFSLAGIDYPKRTVEDTRSEILLWSHYADHHKGVRIGFALDKDYDEFLSFPVDYDVEEVPVLELRKPDELKAMSADDKLNYLKPTMARKCATWRYEREWRILQNKILWKTVSNQPHAFMKLKEGAIFAVDFGVACGEEDKQKIRKGIADNRDRYASWPLFKVRQAKFHPTHYALEYEEIPI